MKNTFRTLLCTATATFIALWGCDQEKTVPLSLDGYTFLKENNNGIEKDRVGKANATGDTVTVYVPHFVTATSLVANFDIPQGASAYVGGTKQHTGGTANDFTDNVDYTISAGQGEELDFTVHCANSLFLSSYGYSADTMRIGAGDFSKEELFKLHNIKNGAWGYTITISGYSYTDTATTENNAFAIPNFLSVEEWLSLNDGEDGELEITLTLSSADNGISSETFAFPLNKEQYKIKSWQDLQAMSYDLYGSYKVHCDIEFPYPGIDKFPKNGFIPIGGSLENSFMGSLDGQDNVISNFYINRADFINERYIGLFGVVERRADILPIIKNLGIEISDREENGGITGGLFTGGIAGWNEGKIINCYVKGDVATSGDNTLPVGAGGLVGYNHNGEIENCAAYGGKVESQVRAGGLVGDNSGEGSISTSWSGQYVVVTGTGGYGHQSVSAGGLASENSMTASIVNCYATGDVVGNQTVGGLVGRHSIDGTIRTSYALGNVTEADADGSPGVGGFIGNIDGETDGRTITDCYWNMAANPGLDGVGEGDTYGVDGRSIREFQNDIMYVGWDFTYTWGIGSTYNSGHAYLIDVKGQETN